MSRLEEKKLVVDELKKVADEALSAVVVDYRGTTVSYTHLTLPTIQPV